MDNLIYLLSGTVYIAIALLFGPYYTKKVIENIMSSKDNKYSREQILLFKRIYDVFFGFAWPVFVLELIITTIKRRVKRA